MTERDFVVREFRDYGRVEIRSAVDPVSLQADPARKAGFKAALGAAVQRATTGVFTHDVEVNLVWLIEESRRYQTHLVADLDNVMKPILDAVTGADGIMIDDNQIQSIDASWMTPAGQTGFELKFTALMRDDYVSREGLSFVEFSADRCYLLPRMDRSAQVALVSRYRQALEGYRRMLDAGIAEGVARNVLPLVRPFPRARLGRFKVLPHADF
ncbi:RusA family crossover junction endodeoxyribonuclease [Streptomyces sp. SLBN-31]|uniref:RusA family crossover junction endodeoxyribonuclease n=1 Tax=Streptomyces sp. SLBN-31 TaxID=2768444 RepID=UPI0013575AB5|nr:RusA family crossover junction endodeoxyribonuclease [Streptomyces sp. SLBN-31]